MTYYHCSPVRGLRVLEPRKPENFDKPGGVYLAAIRPMALMYGIRNFEYTYGYTKDARIVYEEYYHDALRRLYAGRSASLYTCKPVHVETTRIPNERVSYEPVEVVAEERIDDLYEALLMEASRGNILIRRYEELSERLRAWIITAEKKEILNRNLLQTPGPMADYMRCHYPESWAQAERAVLLKD